MVPLLVRPRILTFKNRWTRARNREGVYSRDLVMGLFSLAMMVAIHHGMARSLEFITQHLELAYIPPTIPLGMVAVFLFAMLVFSNSVAAFGAFFHGKDLDLLLASPTPPLRFFFGRFLDILISSSWMAAVFGIPVLTAFMQVYHASWSFLGLAVVALIPFLVIPTSLATCFVLIFGRVVSPNRTKELFVIAALAFLGMAFAVLRVITSAGTSVTDINQLLSLVRVLERSTTDWLPSYWVAAFLGSSLTSPEGPAFVYFNTLLLAAISAATLAFITFRLLHRSAYSFALDRVITRARDARAQERWFKQVTPWMERRFRALVVKDIRSQTRDLGQAIQLLLLLGLCSVCLYNFRILKTMDGLPFALRAWWEGFLMTTNMVLGGFVISAACTRFVFPALSLEGQSFWLLHTAPLPLDSLLKSKQRAWIFPISLFSLTVFMTGAIILHSSPEVILVNLVTCVALAYGIVSLAVGLGAAFAQFEWEHASQLIASFGSMVFMLGSVMLIGITMLPAVLLLYMREPGLSPIQLTPLEWVLGLVAHSGFLVGLHLMVAERALSYGKRVLEKHFS